MNAKPRYALRAMAIAFLMTIGIATTISSGGGGGGSSAGPVTPPSDMVAITGANAHDVSSAFIVAVVLGFDVGDITGGQITGESVGGSTALQKLLGHGDLAGKVSATTATLTDSCIVAGSYTATYTVTDPNTWTVGDQISAVFVNCDDGMGYVMDGQMDMTIAAYQGDINTEVFLLGLDLIMTDMAVTDTNSMETVVANADITLTLDSLAFPVIVETIEGSNLSFTMGSEVLAFTNFEHVWQVDLGVVPEAILVTVSGRLSSAQLDGAIDYSTPVPVEAFGDEDPYIGEILITGDNSSVRIVINSSTSVMLEVDTNGDGVVDEYIETTFAALSGDTSSISSSVALPIAQEVMRASTGFSTIARLPGLQFWDTEPFGQVQQLTVSGDFGPLEIACGHTGIVSVSGFVATAGTFSADDSLSETFSDCERYDGSDLITGQLALVVSSFTQAAEGIEGMTPSFHVIGTATATNLEVASSLSTYVGSGTFETDYEFQDSFGPRFVDAFSPSFSLGHGNVNNTLRDASVNAEISIGDGISRSHGGVLSSDRFPGEYSYQSLSPYFFPTGVYPGQFSEYPHSGELLITAEDGGTLRIVAIGADNVRLDVDSDGDTIIDESIDATWGQLQ